jgi:excisionase family DNA binding protein
MQTTLTVAETAAFLRISKSHVYAMCKVRTNPLPHIKVNGNIRFVKKQIEAYVDRLVQNRVA